MNNVTKAKDFELYTDQELEAIFKEILDGIKQVDKKAQDVMVDRLANKCKPVGALGVLEDVAIKLAGVQRTGKPEITGKAVLVMSGDHGVIEEGVSQCEQSLTDSMFHIFLENKGGINVLANHVGAKVICTDVAMASEPTEANSAQWRITNGTKNFAKESAASRREVLLALLIGAKIAIDEVAEGNNLLATGEVGMANTTPSSALISFFTGRPAADVTNRGTGINDIALERKVKVIDEAIAKHQPHADDPVDVLSKIGGLEIAANVGAILGGAYAGAATILDGIISNAAGLVAYKFKADIVDYLIASHSSAEHGGPIALEAMGLKPCLNMGMRLGEGTGAALMFPICEASIKVANEMGDYA
ncbi:nicotinate-nucleotide--dimethylbenzimidazole phosphoribosyltransferase [Suicoccus acidiformans]|uniref:Nicotinate-nucleotide--dimethylbenzimidazole phosphoribosyltransferase n=1 Tax=Suicoccus acidiformans TaxID=2036206 RepID=A0A347WNV6_9LACT|nr:nicotinate-nucleotide--dimethylbenzimidazole phosphoribosyltransferase [Suicoccus acidiformans]